MSAIPSEFHAIPSTEPPKKRKRCDDPEIYDSSGKTRRVNPYKLGERLGPDLVREMEAYIQPGATMPNFAIRKRLQEKYQVDRRHLYDYFHSRGLRVAKEDRHSNLTRSRQAKAAAAALDGSTTSRKVPKTDLPIHPKNAGHTALSTKLERKKPKSKAVRAPLVQKCANAEGSINEGSKDRGDDTSEDDYTSRTTIYAHENRYPSPLPEPISAQAPMLDKYHDALEDSHPSASQTASPHTDGLPVVETSLPASLPATPIPFNIGDWLAERTAEGSSDTNCSLETIVAKEAEAFSPSDFIKETLDSLNFNYEDYLSFETDPLVAPLTDDMLGDIGTEPVISMEAQMSVPERQQFYNLVNDVLEPLDVSKFSTTSRYLPILSASQESLSNVRPTVVPPLGAIPEHPFPRVEATQECSSAITVAHLLPSQYLRNSASSPPGTINAQMIDRCSYSYLHDTHFYRSDRFFVQTPMHEPSHIRRGYLPPPSRLRAASAGGGI